MQASKVVIRVMAIECVCVSIVGAVLHRSAAQSSLINSSPSLQTTGLFAIGHAQDTANGDRDVDRLSVTLQVQEV